MLMIKAIPTPTTPVEAGRKDILIFIKDTVNLKHQFLCILFNVKSPASHG